MNQPQPFGPYTLLRRIGRGGMAEVFLAETSSAEGERRHLAIKRLLSPYNSDAQLIAMLADEARVSVWLHHPNIVQVFDFGCVGDHHYIAMEFVDGCDLCSLVRAPEGSSGRHLPLATAVYAVHKIADALDYAHRRHHDGNPLRIVHRDVSPHNILVSRDGEVRLTDFGLARAEIATHETQEGIIRGKFAYMPKEQAYGKDIDHRVDIFALGVTLYEALCGVKPYTASNLAQQIYQLEHPIPPPSAILPTLPREIDRITMLAMHPNVEKRYQCAEELAADLADLLSAFGGNPAEQRRDLGAHVMRRIQSREISPPKPPPMTIHEIPINKTSLIADELQSRADNNPPELPKDAPQNVSLDLHETRTDDLLTTKVPVQRRAGVEEKKPPTPTQSMWPKLLLAFVVGLVSGWLLHLWFAAL
jgi:eukaryotic-like serine/threonine-protein kinase